MSENKNTKSTEKKPEVKVRDLQPKKDAKGGGMGHAGSSHAGSSHAGSSHAGSGHAGGRHAGSAGGHAGGAGGVGGHHNR